MYWTIYIIIIAYFVPGTVGIWFVNRNREPEVIRRSWIKHLTYFIIINILFFSITLNVILFRYIAIVIIIAGFIELIKLFMESGYQLQVLYGTDCQFR